MIIKMLLSRVYEKLLELDILDKCVNKLHGFGYVGSASLWDAKKAIALDMAKTLKAHKKFVMSKNYYSVPTWMLKNSETIDSVLSDTLKNRWLDCLDEMILGFQLENDYPIDMSLEERLRIQQRSLDLFHKYYFHLWD